MDKREKSLRSDDLQAQIDQVLEDRSSSKVELSSEELNLLLADSLAHQIDLEAQNAELRRQIENTQQGVRSVAQTANDAIITVDQHSNIVFWNKAAETIFGYSADEALGKSLSFIMPERFRKDHRKGIDRYLRTGDPHLIGSTVKMTGLRKNGGEFPLELSLSSWNNNGEDLFTGIIRDITERKRFEREIESLAGFPSENRNPVFRASQDGIILYANDGSQALLNMWGSQVGQKLPENLCLLITEAIRTEQNRTEEINCEERIFSLDITPIVEAGYVNFYGNDVTERVQFDRLLNDQNQFITTVFESLSYPFYVINTDDFTIQLANSAACAGELTKAVTCYNLLHNKDRPCDQKGLLCPLQEVKKTKRKVIVEHDHFDGHGNVRTFEVHAYPIFDHQGDVSQMIEYSLDITERKRLGEDLRIRSHALGERVKELNCLYSISALVEQPDISLEEVLRGTVEIIPVAWQYPEIAGARIVLGDQEFSTENYDPESTWWQSADVNIHKQRNGIVQVCYLEERAASDEGPFLNEERSLINAIAGQLGKIVERMEAGEVLQQAHDQLELRVKMRTAELEVTNQMLQREIAERKRAYEAEQNARQVAETLTAASQALTQTLEMDTVLNTLLDYLERLVPFDSANIALLGDEACLSVRAVRGYESGMEAEEILSQNYNIEENPQIQEIFTSRKSVQISDISQHPGWKTFFELENTGSWMGLPLIAEGKVIGLCGIDKGETGFFSDEHLNLAEVLVSQATVAIQNAWLFEQVRAGRERLQSLSRRLVETQESERRYISRELHDEAGQALTSLKVGLHLLERDANHPEAVVTGIAELKLMADEILDDLHRLAVNLRPASLDYLGLVAALRQYVESISDKHGLTVQFEAVGFDERLPMDVEIALYRIVQESMTNVVRHAQATRADVILEWRKEKLIIIVEDNGVGIADESIMNNGRLGIVGMRERAEMLGGECTVERTAGTGTTVLVEVPYGN